MISFEKLPPDVQALFNDSWRYDVTDDIALKYNVRGDDYQGELHFLISQTLKGLSHPNNLERRLMDSLHIDSTEATNIATDIRTKIFSKVQASLDDVYRRVAAGEGKEDTVPVKPEPPENLPMMPEEHELVAVKKIIDGSMYKPQTAPATSSIPPQRASQPVNQPPVKVQSQPQPREIPGILNTRLGSSINLPHEEIDLSQQGMKDKISYSSKDPYREPIE